METHIKNYFKLTHLKLYTYMPSQLQTLLSYDNKTNLRIISDLNTLYQDSSIQTYDFMFHALYPDCYIIIWPNNHDTYPWIFSEVVFTASKNIQPIVCCQKCNRIIDIQQFKHASIDYLENIAKHFLYHIGKFYTFKSKCTSRKIPEFHTCDTACAHALMAESQQKFDFTILHTHVKTLAKHIGSSSREDIFKSHESLLKHLRISNDRPISSQIYAIRITAALSSLTHELTYYFPGQKDQLINLHYTLINHLKDKNHFHEQLIFSQEMITPFLHLLNLDESGNLTFMTRQILQYIHIHYSESLTLKYISQHFNIEHSTLSKKFKKEAQLSFNEYLKKYRLKRALLLMKETKLSITEIALTVGFESSTYFSTCFRAEYDSSPTVYRNRFSG